MYNDVCRLCLGTKDLIWIYNDKMADDMKEIIQVTSGVEICRSDSITQMVCGACCQMTIKMYQFRTTSVKNDRDLKALYAGYNVFQLMQSTSSLPIKETAATFSDTETVVKLPPNDKYTHPSIKELLKKHPNLKLPDNCLTLHIGAYVVLSSHEVDVIWKKQTEAALKKRSSAEMADLDKDISINNPKKVKLSDYEQTSPTSSSIRKRIAVHFPEKIKAKLFAVESLENKEKNSPNKPACVIHKSLKLQNKDLLDSSHKVQDNNSCNNDATSSTFRSSENQCIPTAVHGNNADTQATEHNELQSVDMIIDNEFMSPLEIPAGNEEESVKNSLQEETNRKDTEKEDNLISDVPQVHNNVNSINSNRKKVISEFSKTNTNNIISSKSSAKHEAKTDHGRINETSVIFHKTSKSITRDKSVESNGQFGFDRKSDDNNKRTTSVLSDMDHVVEINSLECVSKKSCTQTLEPRTYGGNKNVVQNFERSIPCALNTKSESKTSSTKLNKNASPVSCLEDTRTVYEVNAYKLEDIRNKPDVSNISLTDEKCGLQHNTTETPKQVKDLSCGSTTSFELKDARLELVRVDENKAIRRRYPTAFEFSEQNNDLFSGDAGVAEAKADLVTLKKEVIGAFEEGAAAKDGKIQTIRAIKITKIVEDEKIKQKASCEIRDALHCADTLLFPDTDSDKTNHDIFNSKKELQSNNTTIATNSRKTTRLKVVGINGESFGEVNNRTNEVGLLKKALLGQFRKSDEKCDILCLEKYPIVNGNCSRVKIFHNLCNYLLKYKVPLELKYSRNVHVEYKSVNIPVVSNISGLWASMEPQDIVDNTKYCPAILRKKKSQPIPLSKPTPVSTCSSVTPVNTQSNTSCSTIMIRNTPVNSDKKATHKNPPSHTPLCVALHRASLLATKYKTKHANGQSDTEMISKAQPKSSNTVEIHNIRRIGTSTRHAHSSTTKTSTNKNVQIVQSKTHLPTNCVLMASSAHLTQQKNNATSVYHVVFKPTAVPSTQTGTSIAPATSSYSSPTQTFKAPTAASGLNNIVPSTYLIIGNDCKLITTKCTTTPLILNSTQATYAVSASPNNATNLILVPSSAISSQQKLSSAVESVTSVSNVPTSSEQSCVPSLVPIETNKCNSSGTIPNTVQIMNNIKRHELHPGSTIKVKDLKSLI